MTNEQLESLKAIESAYRDIVDHLSVQRDLYVAEVERGNADYDGITHDDVCIWLIESLP